VWRRVLDKLVVRRWLRGLLRQIEMKAQLVSWWIMRDGDDVRMTDARRRELRPMNVDEGQQGINSPVQLCRDQSPIDLRLSPPLALTVSCQRGISLFQTLITPHQTKPHASPCRQSPKATISSSPAHPASSLRESRALRVAAMVKRPDPRAGPDPRADWGSDTPHWSSLKRGTESEEQSARKPRASTSSSSSRERVVSTTS
jgi:hypothetical protein